mmetsp:Transcript_6020/g.9134  ORF Transcript_6020/g.9134 Transcript_6020/m.9134 type:complete len:207 (+) Transcript_6020:570-1190(+)
MIQSHNEHAVHTVFMVRRNHGFIDAKNLFHEVRGDGSGKIIVHGIHKGENKVMPSVRRALNSVEPGGGRVLIKLVKVLFTKSQNSYHVPSIFGLVHPLVIRGTNNTIRRGPIVTLSVVAIGISGFADVKLISKPQSNSGVAGMSTGAPHNKRVKPIQAQNCKIISRFNLRSRDGDSSSLSLDHLPLHLFSNEINVILEHIFTLEKS